jgi:excisionase family DNA binding protein
LQITIPINELLDELLKWLKANRKAVARLLRDAAVPAIDPARHQLLTAAQVAKRLGVHRNTMNRLISNRQFPAPTWVGSQRKWQASEVTAYIERAKKKKLGKPQSRRMKRKG